MNTLYKRIGCFALVLVLMFCMFTSPVVAPKAEAVAVTLTAGTIALVVALLATVGITFVTADQASQSIQAFVTEKPEAGDIISNWINNGSFGGGPPGSFSFNAGVTAGVITLWNLAKSFFNQKGEGNVEVSDENLGFVGDIQFTYLQTFSSDEEAFEYAPYSISVYNGDNPLSIVVGENTYGYFLESASAMNFNNRLMYYFNGVIKYVYSSFNQIVFTMPTYSTAPVNLQWSHNIDVRFGFRYVSGSTDCLFPYVATSYATETGETKYYSYCPIIVAGALVISDDSITEVTTPVPYKNNSRYAYNDIIEQLEKAIERQGTITVDYKDTLEAIESNQDKQLNLTQEQLLTQIGIKEILEDIKQNTEPENPDINPDDYKAPQGLQYKFPFCIPFDLIALVGALNAEPVTPKWTIPIKLDNAQIDSSLELDFAQFERLAVVIRWGTTLSFVLGLILLTRKLIKG